MKLWVLERAKNVEITLDYASCNLLCSHYENDLNQLNQILYQLSIIYPNTKINIIDIKNLIFNTSSHFNLLNFLNAILEGVYKRSCHILKILETENIFKPLTILHGIQDTILLLMILKRQLVKKNNSLTFLFKKYNIQKNRQLLFIKALQRLTLKQLHQIIPLLLQTELMIYQEYPKIIWNNFKLLILLLCNNIDYNKNK